MHIRKRLSRAVWLAAVCCLCLAQPALAQSTSLELRAEVAAEHSATVVCGEGGRVTLKDGTAVDVSLPVRHYESVGLVVLPDTGYTLQTFLYNGEDMTSLVGDDGIVTLPPALRDTEIRITFEARQSSPGTGEPDQRILWLCLLLPLVLLCMAWSLRRPRRQRKEE